MNAYALRGAILQVGVTTHPHAEAAKQFLAANPVDDPKAIGLAVVVQEDLNLTGPQLAVIFNQLVGDDPEKHVAKFATKPDGQRRVFAALESKYGSQPHEPFNPQEAPEGPKAPSTGAPTNADAQEGSGSQEGQMAAKKKTAKKTKKTPGERKPRAQAPLFVELSGSKPPADMKCGTYIRSLIMKGGKGATTEAILEQVGKHYPDSSAGASDVSWNKGKLKAAGKKIPAAE